MLVVVDALCFSTSVAIAVSRGGTVYPCAKGEDTTERAELLSAEIAIHRTKVPQQGRFSLSPATFRSVTPGTRILLASPNGATCARYAVDVPALFVGAFVNATATADAVTMFLSENPDRGVTVLACGERWHERDEDDGDLRFAVEDYLAAGAILSHLPSFLTRSPEAGAAVAAFRAAQENLLHHLRACGSGIELIERGYPGDVDEAAALDSVSVAPVMKNGGFIHR